MTVRPDLAALTDDAIAVVANRGLLKRALRMQLAEPPAVSASEHEVIARYADGVVTVLSASSAFADASCTCEATGMCRHRVGLVLAYRDLYPLTDIANWSPGEFDDEALREHLGASALRRAERIRRTGYTASVYRPGGDDPSVRVELPHSTVRFLVPRDLRLAHSSASDEATPESIALAVWAVREADARSTDTVHVGGTALQENTVGDPATTLARTVLVDGMANLTEVQRITLRRTVLSMQSSSAVWLADACADLLDQVESYFSRHARHSRVTASTLIADIEARVRIGRTQDSVAAAAALGTDTPGETPLRRTRLIALGAEVSGAGSDIRADVFFAEPDSRTIYLVRHEWTEPAGALPTGHTISTRRVSGATVGALAASTIVTESAVRQANQRIRFGRRGIGRMSLLPLSSDAWSKSLPVVTDYGDEYARLAARKPSCASERILTRGVGVVHVESIVKKQYSPDSQQLVVGVIDRHGTVAQVVVEHRSCAPRAIDTVGDALSCGPATIAGRLTARDGSLQITPFAVAGAHGVIVPDLVAPDAAVTTVPSDTAGASGTAGAPSTPDAALAVLADLAHRGLRHVSDADATRLRRSAAQLAESGMVTSASTLARIADAVTGETLDLADAWFDAVVRLTVAREV